MSLRTLFLLRLDELLKEQKKSYLLLAKYLRVNKNTVYNWKLNRCFPNPEHIAKIAIFLKIPPWFLFSADPTKDAQNEISRALGFSDSSMAAPGNNLSNSISKKGILGSGENLKTAYRILSDEKNKELIEENEENFSGSFEDMKSEMERNIDKDEGEPAESISIARLEIGRP